MNDKKIILNILAQVNIAYKNRDISHADSFFYSLFIQNEPAFVTGTSDNELCFDTESIKKLFISDWKYWGDLNLITDKAIIKTYSDFAWVHCPATVKYTFSDNEETYNKFIGFIREYFDSQSYDAKKSTDIKMAEINWLLAHLLHSREPKENREYFWEIRVFFVLKKVDTRWCIKHIQFSLPKNSLFADERFSPYTYHEKAYISEVEYFVKHSNVKQLSADEYSFIDEFSNAFFINNSSSKEDKIKFLSEDIIFVNTDNLILTNAENTEKKLSEIANFYNEININIDNMITYNSQNNIWLHTNGLLKKQSNRQELCNLTEKRILKILDKDIQKKDKLFSIRRESANLLKECAYGTELIFPFKFNACISKHENRLVFDYIQLSFPFENILEQINDEF